MVHTGKDHPDVDVILNELKRVVEALLMFAIRESKRFKRGEELFQFLDLPLNRENLTRQIRLREFALKLVAP
jgi:hypothetical protein